MGHSVAKCPKLNIKCDGIEMPALLDSGNKVTLLHQSHFEKYLKPANHPSTNNQRHGPC